MNHSSAIRRDLDAARKPGSAGLAHRSSPFGHANAGNAIRPECCASAEGHRLARSDEQAIIAGAVVAFSSGSRSPAPRCAPMRI